MEINVNRLIKILHNIQEKNRKKYFGSIKIKINNTQMKY